MITSATFYLPSGSTITFEVGKPHKMLKSSSGKSQEVRDISIAADTTALIVSILGASDTSVRFYGTPCSYTTV